MKTKLITDSTSSIPKKLLDEQGISVLEILLLEEDHVSKELSEIDCYEFTENFHRMNPILTTSFASPNDALEIFNQAIAEDYEQIFYPYMTEQISNQVNSARIASKRVDKKIKIIFYPTQLAGPSQALFTLYALKMIGKCKDVQDIIEFFNEVKKHIYTMGVSRDFNTLFRTGKVKKNVQMSLLTTILNLKPLCEIPIDKGVIGFGGGMGFRGSLRKILNNIQEKTDEKILFDAIITHSNDIIKANRLEKAIRKIRKINNIKIWELPPAIVCTVGKGAVMITLYPNFEMFKSHSN